MELGLQKRRSSWCDEEDLVWHPWRRWGGRWSWSFLQIADFLPGLSIAIIVVISKMLTMMMTLLMMISASISLLMAMVQVCIAMIYILIWVSRTFISLHLLSTGHSTAIIRCYWNFVLMFIREYFRLIDGNDLTCCRCAAPLAISSAAFVRSLASTSKDLNSRTRSLIFLPALRYISYSASVSAHVNDSCIWHWVIKCYVSFHVAFVTPPDFKPSKWQGGPIAPVQYFPYMQVHHT